MTRSHGQTLRQPTAGPITRRLLTSHTATDSILSGELVSGPNKSTTYSVNAIPAGTYHFHGAVHPDRMNGTFVVT